MAGRSVFISYRRQLSEHLAQRVRDDLVGHDFDPFMDLENLDSGEFDRRILSEIQARMHFIVLLEPGSLDRIGKKSDWLRREIAHALAHGRNIVPVTASGFKFRRNLLLPPDVAKLLKFNAVVIPPGYFDEAMKTLRTRFLKMPVTRSDQQARAMQALVLPAPQLTGQHGNPDRVRLSWSKVSGASAYVLERFKVPPSKNARPVRFHEVYRGPDQSYVEVPDAIPGHPGLPWAIAIMQRWRYRVRADASGQAGLWSDTLDLRTGTMDARTGRSHPRS